MHRYGFLFAAIVLGVMAQKSFQAAPAGTKDLPDLTEQAASKLSEEIRPRVVETYARIQKDPSDPVVMGQMGMLLHAYDQWEIAEPLYRRAFALNGSAFEWIYYLAVVEELQSKSEAAIESYRTALEVNPSYVPATLRLANLLFSSGNWEESRSLYESVLSEFPQLAVAHYGIGRNLVELGRIDQAIEHFDSACSLYPDYGAAHYALGQIYRTLGRLEEAKVHLGAYQKNRLNRAVVGDGLLEAISQLKSADSRAQAHVARGTELGDEGDLEGAIAEHLKAIELEPTFLQAYVNLIILTGKAGRSEDAGQYYRKAIELDPGSEAAYYNYGVVLFGIKDYPAAFDSFSRAVQINPLNSNAHNYIGQLLELKGEVNEAQRSYRSAVKADPQNRMARFNIGRLLIAEGRFEDALGEIEQILTPEDEKTARFLFAMSVAHVRLEQYEEGLEYAEKARKAAERFGQSELIHLIDRDILKLREVLSR